MGQFGKLLLPFGAALFGGLGKSGRQGQQQTSSSFDRTSSGTMTPTEPGYATGFRQNIMSDLGQAIGQAQTPLYGEAQKANYLSSLNELANASMQNLKQNLARSGGLTSGRLASGLSDVETGRLSAAANFFSQLPFMNAQARAQFLNPLLNTAAGLAGRAPTGYTQTGRETGTQQGTQTQFGAPWQRGFMEDLGGFLGAGAGGQGPFSPQNIKSIWDIFRNKSAGGNM